MNIKLVLVFLKRLHIKILHRLQSLEDPLFVVCWELGVAFEKFVFADFCESFNFPIVGPGVQLLPADENCGAFLIILVPEKLADICFRSHGVEIVFEIVAWQTLREFHVDDWRSMKYVVAEHKVLLVVEFYSSDGTL